jgi:hypothetical protein
MLIYQFLPDIVHKQTNQRIVNLFVNHKLNCLFHAIYQSYGQFVQPINLLTKIGRSKAPPLHNGFFNEQS